MIKDGGDERREDIGSKGGRREVDARSMLERNMCESEINNENNA
jgi:hypothetical protein